MIDEHEDKKPTITESIDEYESTEVERPVSKDFEVRKTMYKIQDFKL